MATEIIAGDTVNESSFNGSNDGALVIRVGPNGAKVNGLTVDNAGNVTAAGTVLGSGSPRMELLTAQATTSGTFKDFTIPAWAKKITLMLAGVSTSGTSPVLVRVGTAGGIVSTGYDSSAVSGLSSSTGFIMGGVLATDSRGGVSTIYRLSPTVIVNGSTISTAPTTARDGSGSLTYAGGDITTLRLTTVNGTDTFDAGSVNVLVEGYV
jgi:hypothetical protein